MNTAFRTRYGWGRPDQPASLISVMVTRAELHVLAVGVEHRAIEADHEGRPEAADAFYARATALREAAR